MKPAPRILVLFLLSGCILLSSCAHKIRYSLEDESAWTGTRIPGTVKVETFLDQTPEEEKINVAIGTENWRVNGREGYRKKEIAQGVSTMVAKHLDHSGVFEGVEGPTSEEEADYVLSGTIHDYNATGKVQTKAENAILMSTGMASLAGTAAALAATEDVTTEVSSTVDLRDLELRDSESGDVIFRKDKLKSSSMEDEIYFLEADAPKLFKRVDRELKNVVGELVKALGTSSLAEPVPEEEEVEAVEPEEEAS